MIAGGTYTAKPGAPTIGTATVSGTTASVPFTAPASDGGSTITSYTATSSPGSITGTLSQAGSGTITVSGLTAGTAYTFTVTATNSIGTGPASSASNSITPPVVGQDAYTTAGTYSWVAPTGVTSVSVVAVGAGGGSAKDGGTYQRPGGGGGALVYKNSITVSPGSSYTVVVGAAGVGGDTSGTVWGTDGGLSSFAAGFGTMTAGGGGGGRFTGTPPTGPANVGGVPSGTYDGGGTGGAGATNNDVGGGGGAAGYSGNGGAGANNGVATAPSGSGGGGGGGAAYGGSYGGGGGGVGILGQGSNGAGGTSGSTESNNGKGGSGGADGVAGDGTRIPNGGAYGGGGAFKNNIGGDGAVGAVRIIYPGTTRTFPSTNTGNL